MVAWNATTAEAQCSENVIDRLAISEVVYLHRIIKQGYLKKLLLFQIAFMLLNFFNVNVLIINNASNGDTIK